MVSRLSPDKGHEDLINAFSKLTQEYKDKMDIIIIVKVHKLGDLSKSALYR